MFPLTSLTLPTTMGLGIKLVLYTVLGDHLQCLVSQATPFAERGRVWSHCNHQVVPQQKLDVVNQIRALRRLHPLSWSTTCMIRGCQHFII